MFRKIIFSLFILLPVLLPAQFSDNFSDGDFSQNPAWTGTAGKFVVENQMLRLSDNQAGEAWLATPSTVMNNTQWEFWVRLAFTPSNNNHPRIYLVSDSQDLSGPLNGYYIRIGKDGGDNKRLYFYRQNGETSTEILAGAINFATTTNNRMRIKAIRDDQGNWEFWADPAGGELYLPQGSVSDNQHTSTQWFGVLCRYTVSNASNFWFDDFYVGDIIIDDTPPAIASVTASGPSTLEIQFTKAVEPLSAQLVSNYFVNQGIGEPNSAVRHAATPDRVTLSFAGTFTLGQSYTLTVMNVEDFPGNIMLPFTGTFVWYQPVRFDVVFSEIMANPTPAVGVPPHEYVELYNTTAFPINLEGWTFQHGNSQRILPAAIIEPDSYIVLTSAGALDDLQAFGNVIAVPGMATNALTNAGITLILYNREFELISWVSYSDSWYGDASKSGGGWALEKIDLLNYCQGAANWRASVSEQGGTPGTVNSVNGTNPDVSAPHLLRAGVQTPQRINVFFSEPMDDATLADPDAYFVDQGIGSPQEVILFEPDFRRIDLIFSQPLQPGVIYELRASQNLADCAGNNLHQNIARIAVPQTADSLDIVINEVLFNPPERGVRYVELYNRSQKNIDLKDYMLSSRDTIANLLSGTRDISSESWLMFPGDYVVLTPDPAVVQSQFMTSNPGGFIQMTLSSMTNTRGIIVLASKGQRIIDQLVYEENMHYPLLTTRRGVALERINYHRPTQSRSNWHSAAQSAGFGTPGYRNSQFTLDPEGQEDVFELYPRVFSPDNDGVDDVLNISWKLESAGFTANVVVYDSRGRRIRTLARSELLSMEGVMVWDGATDQGQKADMGIYIIHIELFNPSGQVKTYRKTAVLGGRL